MKMKHFTFDLDYFPITNSNVFQQIKIDRNKNPLSNKLPLKRFPLKNQLNLQGIPDIMFFQKSNKKPKIIIEPQIFSPISNQTKKSQNHSCDQIQWSFIRRIDKNLQTERKVQSCPKPASANQNLSNISFLRNSLKSSNKNDNERQSQKSHFAHEINYVQRNSHKNSQLQSLEECQSEFDQSSHDSLAASKQLKNKQINEIQINQRSKKKKPSNLDKHNKSKKTQKSHSSKNNNPQIISNKQKINKKNPDSMVEKDQNKTGNVPKNEEATKCKNKFISLTRKSYYLVGSKNNKNRSLNKQKKQKKNNSLREDGNVILSNGDISQHSSTGPSNYRNSSLSSSTANSKAKVESSKNNYSSVNKNKKSKKDSHNSQLFEIVKRTGYILDKYKDQCTLLKKQKEQYQEKYEEAVKKLNRIKEQIQQVMKTQ